MQTAKRFPEVLALVLFLIVWIFGVLVLGLPMNIPDAASWKFVTVHYFSPLALAIFIQLALTFGAATFRDSGPDYDPWLALRLLPFVIVVVFLHFNFKCWTPLITSRVYDPLYHQFDLALQPVLSLSLIIRQAVASALPVSVDSAYHGLFILTFLVSWTTHPIYDTSLGTRRVVFATSLVLLVGGVSYWIAPAIGPFIYGSGPNAVATSTQENLWLARQFIIKTRQFPPGCFTAALAAMPSLHIANLLVFIIYGKRIRWSWMVYLPVLAWTLVESTMSRYHYLADLPAGALLAIACVYCTNRIFPDKLIAAGITEALKIELAEAKK